MKTIPALLLLALILFHSPALQAQVEVIKTENGWSLTVDKEIFPVKGVTFGYDKDTANYEKHFSELQLMGVNTIRTWATGSNTLRLLDAAQAQNIKVMMGIWMRHGRPGMEDDDHFDYLTDETGIQAMYENALNVVQTYKDHPAVLTWGIGNEVYLNMATDEEKVAYSQLLEKICKEIKQLDTNHPITSVEAWTFGVDWWEKYVPSLDIYGINCYGPGANILPEELEKKGVTKPYVITEFGVTGEWDSQKDENGVVVEPDDEAKYEAVNTGYRDWIRNKPSCLGVYFFHYADGNDHIAPWLFTHVEGFTRPQYWAIREAYTGQAPTNKPPAIASFNLPKGSFLSEKWIPVTLSASDPDSEILNYSFAYNQRTGSRKRRDQILPLEQRKTTEGFEILLPKEHGAIKVYARVTDDSQNMGIATASILVEDEDRKNTKFLVPKMELPFYVYQDGKENPYAPSAYMGNYESMNVDLLGTKEVYAGDAALEVSYNARDNWYGVALVDPANDWGDILGGYDLSGAKKFSFWAKADDVNVTAKIGYGLIDTDKPYPDSSKELLEIKLSTKWKQYSINLKKKDLSCIRSGLVLFSSSNGFPHKIYIDEVIFE